MDFYCLCVDSNVDPYHFYCLCVDSNVDPYHDITFLELQEGVYDRVE